MARSVLLMFPDSEDEVLALASESPGNLLKDLDLLTGSGSNPQKYQYSAYYHSKNLKAFEVALDNVVQSGFCADGWGGVMNRLRVIFGRKIKGLNEGDLPSGDSLYFSWSLHDERADRLHNDGTDVLKKKAVELAFSQWGIVPVIYFFSQKQTSGTLTFFVDRHNDENMPDKFSKVRVASSWSLLEQIFHELPPLTRKIVEDGSRFSKTGLSSGHGSPVYLEKNTGFHWYEDKFHQQFDKGKHYEIFDEKDCYYGTADFTTGEKTKSNLKRSAPWSDESRKPKKSLKK